MDKVTMFSAEESLAMCQRLAEAAPVAFSWTQEWSLWVGCQTGLTEPMAAITALWLALVVGPAAIAGTVAALFAASGSNN